jgi:hypothetical protein
MRSTRVAAATAVLVIAAAGCSTSLRAEPGYAHALAAGYCSNFGTFDSPRDLKSGYLMVEVDKRYSDRTRHDGNDLSTVSTWRPLGDALEDVGNLGPSSTWDSKAKSSYLAALPKIWRACKVADLNPKGRGLEGRPPSG